MVLGLALSAMTIYAMIDAFSDIVEQGGMPEAGDLARSVRGALWYTAQGVPIFITGLIVLIIGCRRERRILRDQQKPNSEGGS